MNTVLQRLITDLETCFKDDMKINFLNRKKMVICIKEFGQDHSKETPLEISSINLYFLRISCHDAL